MLEPEQASATSHSERAGRRGRRQGGGSDADMISLLLSSGLARASPTRSATDRSRATVGQPTFRPRRRRGRRCSGRLSRTSGGASRTRTGDLLGAIQAAWRLNLAGLQAFRCACTPLPGPKLIRILRDFAGVLARGGRRVAKTARPIVSPAGCDKGSQSPPRAVVLHARRVEGGRVNDERSTDRRHRRWPIGGACSRARLWPARQSWPSW